MRPQTLPDAEDPCVHSIEAGPVTIVVAMAENRVIGHYLLPSKVP